MPQGERSPSGYRPPGFDDRFLAKWREDIADRCGIEFDLVAIVDGDLQLEYSHPPPEDGDISDISGDSSCIISYGFSLLYGLAERDAWTPDRVYVTAKCPDWEVQNTWYFDTEWACAWFEDDLSEDEIERRVKDQEHSTEMDCPNRPRF